MAEISPVEIPNRPLFKSAEVCDLAKVQPYVLRSWEAEFKDLGVAKAGSTARVYRREDVERVLRIKHLLLIEGLTLAGVRRKLEEETEPSLDLELPEEPAQAPAVGHPIARVVVDARDRIEVVRRGLKSLLDLLDSPAGAVAGAGAKVAADTPVTASLFESEPSTGEAAIEPGTKAPRGSKDESTKSASPRRKRSA